VCGVLSVCGCMCEACVCGGVWLCEGGRVSCV